MKIKMFFALCMLLCGLFLAVSCEKTVTTLPKEDEKVFPATVTPILILKETSISLYPYIAQNIVITNTKEWHDSIISRLYDYELESFLETDVDFSAYQVIAVIDKQCRPNWTIDITDITENTDNIIVTYTNLDTTLCVASIFVRPCHIIKIPKSDKKITFIYDETMRGGKTL